MKSQPTIKDLRIRSREVYLEKREAQKLQLLKTSIADEEAIFSNEELTQFEQEQLEMRKKISLLATQKVALEEKEQVHQYSMPESIYNFS